MSFDPNSTMDPEQFRSVRTPLPSNEENAFEEKLRSSLECKFVQSWNSKEINAYIREKIEAVDDLFKSVHLQGKTGMITPEQEKEYYARFCDTLITLTEELPPAKSGEVDKRELKETAAQIKRELQKLGRAADATEYYTKFNAIYGEMEEALLKLNEQTDALELGGGDYGFINYTLLLTKPVIELMEFYGIVKGIEDPSVRVDLLKMLKDLVQTINGARDDFMHRITNDYGVELDEAVARFKVAAAEKEKGVEGAQVKLEGAWRGILQLNRDYQKAALALSGVSKLMQSLIGEEPPKETVWKMIKNIGHALLHPTEGLRYDVKNEAILKEDSFRKELQKLKKDVENDTLFLQKLSEESTNVKLERSSLRNGLPEDIEGMAAPATEPLTNAGLKRARRYTYARFQHEEAAKPIDERYRARLNSVFLAAQLFSGAQWMFNTLPQQAENYRRQADDLQNAVIDAVPQETAARIAKDSSTLDRLLSEKYTQIQDKKVLEKLTKRSPDIRSCLEEVIGTYGSSPPPPEIRSRIVNDFMTFQMVHGSSHHAAIPFRGVSVKEWWDHFTTPEEAPLEYPPNATVVEAAVPAADGTHNTMTASAVTTGVVWESVKRTIGTLGSTLSRMLWEPREEELLRIEESVAQELDKAGQYLRATKEDAVELGIPQSGLSKLESAKKILDAAIGMFASRDASATRYSQQQQLDHIAETIEKAQIAIADVDDFARQFHYEQVYLKNLQAFIDAPAAISIDSPLLQHVIGSYFGKGTGLEGYDASKVLRYLLSLVSEKVRILREDPVCTDESRLNFCRTFFESGNVDIPLELFSTLEKRMITADKIGKSYRSDSAAFISHFGRLAKELQAEDSFFFQGLWELDVSHSIVYEVVKQENGHFTFRVYNRGAGVDFSQDALVEGQKYYFPFTEIVDITPDSLMSPAFLKALQEMGPLNSNDKKWSAAYFYEVILPLLGGSVSGKVYSKEELMEGLQVGHCTYLSMTALLSQHLGDVRSYSRWQHEVELKTVITYFQQHERELKTDETARKLMDQALKQLGRNLDKGFAEGLLTESELKWINQQLAPIRRGVKAAEAAYQAATAELAPVFALVKSNYDFRRPVFRPKSLLSIEDQKPLDNSLIGWSPAYRSDTFAEDLATFASYTTEGGPLAYEPHSIKEGVKQFVAKIPLEGDVFWEKLTVDQAKEVIHDLSKLSGSFLQSVYQTNGVDVQRNHALLTENFIAQAKLLTLADAVARRFSKEFGFELSDSICQKEMYDFIQGKTIYTKTLSPSDAEAIRDLNAYWNRVDPAEVRANRDLSFFGFEMQNPGLQEHKERKICENADDAFKVWNERPGDFAEVMYAWKDVPFAMKWLERPGEMAKFDHAYPQFSHEGAFFKGIRILADYLNDQSKEDWKSSLYRPNILPQEFFDLRDLAYHAQLMLKGPWYEARAEFKLRTSAFVKVIKTTQELLDGRKIPYWKLSYSPELKDEYGQNIRPKAYDFHSYRPGEVANQMSSIPDFLFEKRLQNGQEGVGAFDPLIGGTVIKEFRSTERKLPLERHGWRKRLTPHERQLLRIIEPEEDQPFTRMDSSTAKGDFPREEAKALAALSSVKELQIQETFSYFIRNAYQLRQESYQRLFIYLLSDQGLLIDEFLRSPDHAVRFATSFAEFCNTQLELYGSTGDTRTELFYLSLANLFGSYVDFTRDSFPGSFPDGFVLPISPIGNQMRRIMKSAQTSGEEKATSAYEMIKLISRKDAFTGEDIADIFEAYVIMSNYPPKPGEAGWHMEIILDRRDILGKLSNRLKEAVSGVNQDSVLNALLKRLQPESAPLSWSPYNHFPRFIANDGFTTVDLQQGKILLKGSGLKPLPETVRNHPIVTSIFGENNPVMVNEVAWEHYAFVDKEGRDCLIKTDQENLEAFQRKFNGEWFLVLDTKLNQYTYDLNDGDLSKQPYNHLFSHTVRWANSDSKYKNYIKDLFIFTDENTDTIKYRISEFGSDILIHKANVDGTASNLVLENSYDDNSPYAVLRRFESRDHTFIWRDRDSRETKLIEMPDFGLDFEVKQMGAEAKAYCSQLPGYYIAAKQHVAALGDVTNYLVLEKEIKPGVYRQSVIMPRQEIAIPKETQHTKTEGKKGPSKFETKIELERTPGEHQSYLVYDIDPESKLLMPRNTEGRFFAAMVYLWKRDYVAAMHYLKGFGTELRAYTDGEKGVLNLIQYLNDKNRDYTPEGKSVRMYAAFLMMRNTLDFTDELIEKLNWDKIATDYTEYVEAAKQMGISLLTPDDERLIIRYFDDSHLDKPAILARIKALYPEKYLSWGNEVNASMPGFIPTDRRFPEVWGFWDYLDSRIYGSYLEYSMAVILGYAFINRPSSLAVSVSTNPLADASSFTAKSFSSKDEKWDTNWVYDPTSTWGGRLRFDDNDRKFVKEIKDTYNDATSRTNVLQRNLLKAVNLFYSDLYHKSYEKLPLMYYFLHGVHPPDGMTSEDLKREISKVLWLSRFSNNVNYSEEAACLLGKVLDDPSGMIHPDILLDEAAFSKWQESHLISAPRLVKDLKTWIPASLSSYFSKLPFIKGTVEQEVANLGGALDVDPRLRREDLFPLRKKESSLTSEPAQAPIEMQTSVNLDLFEDTFVPVAADVSPYLNVIPISNATKMERVKTASELRSVFDLKTDDAVANRMFASLREDLSGYVEDKERPVESYELKDIGKLNELKNGLQILALESSDLLMNSQAEILSLANKAYEDPLLEAQRVIRIQGNLEKPLLMDELLQLYRNRDRELFYKRNPALNAEDVDALMKALQSFLVLAVNRQHDLRIVNTINQIEKLSLDPLKKKELDILTNELGTLLWSERSYILSDNPEYLNLEYHLEILIRGDQTVNLEKLGIFVKRGDGKQENGVALEAIPGSGKTSVMLILKVLADADGVHLPVVVMPESLMPSMSKDLQERHWSTFGGLVEIMSFDRDSEFDQENLERIRDRLKAIIGGKEQRVLLLTDSSVQSLFLKFVEKVENYLDYNRQRGLVDTAREQIGIVKSGIRQYWRNEDKEKYAPAMTLRKEITAFREILEIFRNSGAVSIDEMDLILDILKAHHFTLGEPVPVHKSVLDSTMDLYSFISSSEEIQKKIRFGFLEDRGGAPFDPLLYEKEVQPLLIETILKGEVSAGDEELTSFFSTLTSEQKQWLTDYLNNLSNKEAQRFVDSIFSQNVKNRLAIYKEQVSRVLPLTAKKQLNEHYGPLPKDAPHRTDQDLLAIPYHGSNNPVTNSQFGTDLEIIDFTVDMHMGAGLPESVVRKEIDILRSVIEEELKTGKISRPEDSPSYRRFLRLCGGDKGYRIFTLSNEDYAAITALVNKQSAVKLDLIRRYALPQVRNYEKQLHTSGLIYAAMFKRVRGFTGTLWNAEAFPNMFAEILASNTMAKTLNILWEKSSQKVAQVSFKIQKVESREETINKMVKAIGGGDEFKGSFADAAGLFRDVEDNMVIAGEILKLQPSNIEGIAYYSKDNELLVLVRGQKNGVPIDQCGVPKEKLVAYWDQKHTTGSDIKLGIEMTAKVSVGQYTFMRDLIQAVWRLRGLDKGQKVDFIVSEVDQVIIRDTLGRITGKPVKGELELKHLLLYTMYNQAMRQGDDNYRSFKQKLQTVLISKVLEVAVDPDVPFDEMIGMMEHVDSLFVNKHSREPYDQYGAVQGVGERNEVVEEELKKVIEGPVVEFFKTNPTLSQRYPYDKLVQELKDVVAKEIEKLPEKLPQQTNYQTEVAVQVETKTETKTEMKAEVKTEMKTEMKTEVQRRVELYGGEWSGTTPRPNIEWDGDAVFSQKSYLATAIETVKNANLLFYGVSNLMTMGITPVVSLRDVFNSEALIREYADVFDESVVATINQMPVFSPWFFSFEPSYRPFGRYHDNDPHIIIVENKATGKMQFVLGDQEDARQFENILRNEAKNPTSSKGDVRVCLYNLFSGMAVEQGSDPIDPVAIKQNPQIIQLITQAKFFKGGLQYSDAEIGYLEKWIEEKGIKKMFDLFYGVILANHPDSLKRFEHSDIGKVFTALTALNP